MPTSDGVLLATYADDTAVLAADTLPDSAANIVQNYINILEKWFLKWRIKVNSAKCKHVDFTLRKGSCPHLYINEEAIPRDEQVKYLGLHLDRRLTWSSHIRAKKTQCNIKARKLYWLLGRASQLRLENKILIYKVILKPVWTYGIQLWATASVSNIEILQRFQNKILRMIVNAPWYVSNQTIQRDLNIRTVK